MGRLNKVVQGASLCIVLLASGCVGGLHDVLFVNPHDNKSVKARISIEHDPYRNTLTAIGPLVALPTASLNHRGHFGIRSWALDKRKFKPTDSVLIYITAYFSDWAYLDSAYMKGGKKLDVTAIDRDVVNCSSGYSCEINETVGIIFTVEELREWLKEGELSHSLEHSHSLDFKLVGSHGSREVSVSKVYIKTFLDFIESYNSAP